MSYSRAADYKDEEQLIATYSKITAHPARLRILKQLSTNPLTLYQLTEDHPAPQSTVMRHLNVLISYRLVTIESTSSPATYTSLKNDWPPFIQHAVRLAYRFNYANAA